MHFTNFCNAFPVRCRVGSAIGFRTRVPKIDEVGTDNPMATHNEHCNELG